MAQPDYYNRPRTEMLAFVPAKARRILDVGCGGGAFAGRLKAEREAEVWGIELDPAAAAAAAGVLDRVLTGDASEVLAGVPDDSFDCIVLNDILEHLVHPERLLQALRPKLAEGGALVASVPSVRHIHNLWDLVVRGRWEYTDEGILDRTHLRFFTRSSLGGLFERGGFSLRRTVGINPTRSWKFRLVNLFSLGRWAEMRFLQFACVAVPADRSEEAPPEGSP